MAAKPSRLVYQKIRYERQRFRSGFCTGCSSYDMTGVGFCGWALPHIRLRNGSPVSWSRSADGTGLHAISSATAIAAKGRCSFGVFAPWASEIDRPHRDRRGKMDMRNG